MGTSFRFTRQLYCAILLITKNGSINLIDIIGSAKLSAIETTTYPTVGDLFSNAMN